MGKNNRARRAAKAKRRTKGYDKRRGSSSRGDPFGGFASSGEPILTTAELVEGLLDLAAAAPRYRDVGVADRAVERLCMLDASVVTREAERQVRRMVAAAWNGGWQPLELARQVRRATDAVTARLALVAIAADHAVRAESTLDSRWVEQLGELDLPAVAAGTALLAAWARDEQLTWPEQVRSVVALLQSLAAISVIQILIPPPGAGSDHEAIIDLTSKADDPMLNRVRALLAQAESTNYQAEAEAFTAKAQELMTRHAIDMAMVSTSTRRSERPATIRIPIDEPYVDAKSLLLQIVAENSRCRAAFHQRFAMSSVVGFADDLNATETLFTSLLVQAQVAMHAAATSAPPGTRTRSRSFRAAFLLAYAERVAERLAEINSYVVADAEAESGQAILPVLAARSSLVDATVAEIFGQLTTSAVRGGHDPAGWASGHMAADRAQLSFGGLAQADLTFSDPALSVAPTN
ncbi:MAG: DUF2786 domain-containing protein [Acidimicrobiia bacterium]